LAKAKKKTLIKIRWIRFPNDPSAKFNDSLKKPLAFAVCGGTGSGKSSLVELIASKYTKVIDLFGSRDNEGLAWLRSPNVKKALLLKGSSVKVDCTCADVMDASKFKVSDAEPYDVVISASAFYSTLEEEWHCVSKIMQALWRRTHWREPWALTIREASNLIYSRQNLGDNQALAKAYITYVVREMRHCGFAVCLDTIRWYGIDIDFRSVADYTFLKSQGIDGLPRDLRFLYKYFHPFGVMRCPVERFIIVSRKGPLGFGRSVMLPWHKQEHEDMLRLFDIKISYSEIPFSGEKGLGKVGDYEHLRIIKARIENKQGMDRLAKDIGRSSRTIWLHINMHNNMVHAVGECDRCARANGQYTKTPVEILK